jgi:catechol 2,3-dioxygenase-like lactoylglutathione lyase family enzyme
MRRRMRFPRGGNQPGSTNHMQSHLAHLEVKIDSANAGFYKDLFAFIGWNTLYEDDSILGVGGTNEASLWFSSGANGAQNDYDGRGVNHIGIGAQSIADVDALTGYLKGKGIAALFETPRHRPDFASSESDTYYQVMFESPDRVLFEFVYTGPK